MLCHQNYGFTLEDVKEVIVAGFKSAFLPHREKSELLKKVNAELAKFQEPASIGSIKQRSPKNNMMKHMSPDFAREP
jgi:adenosine deaminase